MADAGSILGAAFLKWAFGKVASTVGESVLRLIRGDRLAGAISEAVKADPRLNELCSSSPSVDATRFTDAVKRELFRLTLSGDAPSLATFLLSNHIIVLPGITLGDS